MSLWTLEYLTLNALLSLFNLSAARIWQCILLDVCLEICVYQVTVSIRLCTFVPMTNISHFTWTAFLIRFNLNNELSVSLAH